MNIRGSSLFLRGASLLFIVLAVILTVFQLIRYSLSRTNYPSGMTIAGVPVGGIDPQTASQRLLQVYSVPIELHYGNAVIDMAPNAIGFQLDVESMLAAADLQRTGASFWGGFWDYLWNRHSPASDIPLVATYSEQRLRAYLQDDIASHYDQSPLPSQPIANSTDFKPGTPGQTLDIDRAVVLIEDALKSPTSRVVILSAQTTAAGRPPLPTLKVDMENIINLNNFDGLIDIYFLDLQTGEALHFGYQAGQEISVNPDISFSGLSTEKIAILVTAYLYNNGKLPDTLNSLVVNMIATSTDSVADQVMQSINPIRGPLLVTQTMQKLGLINTFMAGFYYLGAPLLQIFNTPANSRTDINTDPDPYDQTTPSDLGLLLEALYQCSQTGGGSLIAAFPGQLTQTACQQMIQTLTQDQVGALIQTGVPEGTVVAHKHGWVADAASGVIHNMSDAALIYSPGGNYILTIYTYHPVQIIWEDANGLGVNHMYADLSRLVYNYMNLP